MVKTGKIANTCNGESKNSKNNITFVGPRTLNTTLPAKSYM